MRQQQQQQQQGEERGGTGGQEDVEEEEDNLASLMTCISSLEKIQGDILTMLQLLNDYFNAVPKIPLESV